MLRALKPSLKCLAWDLAILNVISILLFLSGSLDACVSTGRRCRATVTSMWVDNEAGERVMESIVFHATRDESQVPF